MRGARGDSMPGDSMPGDFMRGDFMRGAYSNSMCGPRRHCKGATDLRARLNT
jgi:hypothetical protein